VPFQSGSSRPTGWKNRRQRRRLRRKRVDADRDPGKPARAFIFLAASSSHHEQGLLPQRGATFIKVRLQSPSPHPGGSWPAIQNVEREEPGLAENTTKLWLLQPASLKLESV
jgi:hypothetical protein